MDGNAFDAFTRRAADAVSRRGSLLAIGGAALGAATLAPARVSAKKKCKKKCQKQIGKCEDEVRQFCQGLVSEREDLCRQTFLSCCQSLGTCDSAGSTECFLDNAIIVLCPVE